MTDPSHTHTHTESVFFLENQIRIIRRVSDLWPGFWFSPRVVERVGGGSPAVQLKHYQWSQWPYVSLEWRSLIIYIFNVCLTTTSQFTCVLVPLDITHFTGVISIFLSYLKNEKCFLRTICLSRFMLLDSGCVRFSLRQPKGCDFWGRAVAQETERVV